MHSVLDRELILRQGLAATAGLQPGASALSVAADMGSSMYDGQHSRLDASDTDSRPAVASNNGQGQGAATEPTLFIDVDCNDTRPALSEPTQPGSPGAAEEEDFPAAATPEGCQL